LKAVEAQFSELLAGESFDALRQQLTVVEASLHDRLNRFTHWKESPPVLSELQSSYEKSRKVIQDAVDKAGDDFDAAQLAWQNLEKAQTKLGADVRNLKLNRDAASDRVKDLLKDGLSDEAREKARAESLLTWEAARIQAKECQRKLAEIPGEPLKTLKNLEAQAKALEQSEQAARDREKKAEGNLQTLALEGTYSKLAACEERLSDLQERLRKEKLRMESAKLLYDTVSGCKAAIVAAIAAPVETAATRMLSRIAGPRLGTIRLTDAFVPFGVQPELSGDKVDLGNLSGGEQEQLFLVTRLALGEVLARKERQLVVLDDVLNATDTARLARMLTLLEEASERLQIVILTCHPERYRALESAKFFDLQPLC
jgi:uncharacterized protein YhaN